MRRSHIDRGMIGVDIPLPVELHECTKSGQYPLKLHFNTVKFTLRTIPHCKHNTEKL